MTKKEVIEKQREFWASLARRNGWYAKPFHVQVWFNEDGSLRDSVSFAGLTEDIIITVRDDGEEVVEGQA